LEEALQVLSLQGLNEEAIKEVCTEFVTEDLGYARCLVFIHMVLLPMVQNLRTTASRTMIATLSYCAQLHPKPVLYGLLIPLSQQPDIGTSQSEIVKKLIKECYTNTPDLCVLFLYEILIQKETLWTEVSIGIVQNMININLQLDDEVCGLMIAKIGHHVGQGNLASNLKFTTLIFTFISKYPSLIKPFRTILHQILSKCQTYMSKSALIKLDAIQ